MEDRRTNRMDQSIASQSFTMHHEGVETKSGTRTETPLARKA